MNLSFVSNILAKNSYINSVFYKHWKSSSTDRALAISHAMRNDDSISDISNIRKLRYEIEKGKTWIPGDINIANSMNYGISNALFPFKETSAITPSVEHGLIFYDSVFQDVLHTAPMTCATMGHFRPQKIQAARKIPVFVVGPYIQYSKSFYSAERLKKYKNANGKTLVVFPAHSTDFSNISFNEKDYLSLVKQYAKKFDTVCVCSFWWNINDSLIRRFESEGFKIVSAGFRDDISFLPRLKTIIQSADLIIGNNIGTHIGYSFSLRVPFELVNIKFSQKTLVAEENANEQPRKNRLRELEEVLYSGNNQAIEALMNYYWGNDIYRNLAERKAMCEITSDLRSYTKGFFNKVPEASLKLINDYENAHMDIHASLLRDAISNL